MDKIKQISSIFAIARSHLSRQSKANSSKIKKQAMPAPKKKVQKISSSELKKSISEKLRALDNQSEHYTRLANNIFLESVLLWEFGEEIINDPEFHQMIEKINATICDSEETSQKFSLLIKQMTE